MLPAIPDKSHPPSKPPSPGLARLAVSTSASAAVLGAAVGIGEHSVILGVVFAVVGAGLRLAIAAWRQVRSLPVEAIDPVSLPEPWRAFVQQAVDAERRFRSAVEAWPAGPLRERLESLEPTLDAEVRGVWVAARQGATLSGSYPPGSKRTAPTDLSAELEAVQLERSELRAGNQARREELDRAEQALATELQAARRAQSTAEAVADRLRILVARLNEAVTSVVAVTAGPGGAGDVEAAAGTIDGLAEELAALQAGIAGTAELPAGTALPEAGPQSRPPTS